MTKTTLKKLKENVAAFITIATVVAGVASFGWCKIAVPEVKKIARKEQESTVKILEQLLEETEFQNFLIMSEKSVADIKAAKDRWKQFKIEKKK